MKRSVIVVATVMMLLSGGATTLQADDWFTQKSDWHGFERFHFTVAERPAYVVTPKSAAKGHPWVWRARFPDFHYEMDVELLKQGFHVAYVDVAAMFGNARAMEIGDQFYAYMTKQRGLSLKPVMEGVSRGGLFVYNWVVRNPDKVSCIYCDTPVLDFKSWPAGQGDGIGSESTWKQCLAAYSISEEEALTYEGNPVDAAPEVIATHKIPMLHIVSENDVVVPPKENTYILQRKLKTLGHQMDVISVAQGTEKSHGHHFTHPDPGRVVSFVVTHAR